MAAEPEYAGRDDRRQIGDMWQALSDPAAHGFEGELVPWVGPDGRPGPPGAPAFAAYQLGTIDTTTRAGARRAWTARVELHAAGPAGAAPAGAAGDPLPFEPADLARPARDLPGRVAVLTKTNLRWPAAAPPGAEPSRTDARVVVRRGKNAGRANATNVLTQALRDAIGLWMDKARKSEKDADLPPPMLVSYADSTPATRLTPEVFARGVTAQRKHDGVRAVLAADAAGPFLYSRSGVRYPHFAHLDAPARRLLAAAPPADAAFLAAHTGREPADVPAAEAAAYAAPPFLDGELYRHGRSLNDISGFARRGQPEGTPEGDRLGLEAFDVFWPAAVAAGFALPSAARQAYLDAWFEAAGPVPPIERVENIPVATRAEVEALYRRVLAEGYEGLVLRKDDQPYEFSYSATGRSHHSTHLLKLKPVLDSEFPVVGYEEGRGASAGAVIWVCGPDAEMRARSQGRDATFKVVPKMPLADRKKIFAALGQRVPGGKGATVTRFERDFAGVLLRVEFATRADKTGIPQQPRAVAFRPPGGGRDPVERLLAEA